MTQVRLIGVAAMLAGTACARDARTPAAARDSVAASTPASAPAAVPDTPPATARQDTTTGSAADSGEFRGSTDAVAAKGNAPEVTVLNAVRGARHPTFERIVFEFRANVVPGYSVAYASSAPTQCGSGEVMKVAGGAHLEVRFSPAQAHAPVGEDERSTLPARSIALNYPAVRELTVSCDFEAVLSWVVGVDAQRPFRVMRLRDPARVVLDIAVTPPK